MSNFYVGGAAPGFGIDALHHRLARSTIFFCEELAMKMVQSVQGLSGTCLSITQDPVMAV